jgi:hypothetical protein
MAILMAGTSGSTLGVYLNAVYMRLGGIMQCCHVSVRHVVV